ADIPATDCITQAAAPTAQSVYILGEVEQVGADPADLGQVLESQSLGFTGTVSRCEGQRKHSRVVLRRPTAVADFDDALHGANTVQLDAADHCVVVLLHQIAFGDVVGSTLGAEDQEPVEPGPVVDLPRVATARVCHLGRARDWAGLWGDASVEELCVVNSHVGLLFVSAPPTLGTISLV